MLSYVRPDRTQLTLSGISQQTNKCIIKVQPGIFFRCFDFYIEINWGPQCNKIHTKTKSIICVWRILHMTDQFSWSHWVCHIQVHLYRETWLPASTEHAQSTNCELLDYTQLRLTCSGWPAGFISTCFYLSKSQPVILLKGTLEWCINLQTIWRKIVDKSTDV